MASSDPECCRGWCKANRCRARSLDSGPPFGLAWTPQLEAACVIRQTRGLPAARYPLGIRATYFPSSAVPKQTQPAGQGWKSECMLWDKGQPREEGWMQQSGPAVWPTASFGGLCYSPSGFITVLSLGEPHSQRGQAREAARGGGHGTPAASDKINIRIRAQFWLPPLNVFPVALLFLIPCWLIPLSSLALCLAPLPSSQSRPSLPSLPPSFPAVLPDRPVIMGQ